MVDDIKMAMVACTPRGGPISNRCSGKITLVDPEGSGKIALAAEGTGKIALAAEGTGKIVTLFTE